MNDIVIIAGASRGIGELGPEIVTPAAVEALTSDTPEFRYVVGKGPQSNALPPANSAFYQSFLANFWPK